MGEENICKDFQRNLCFRGDSCKYEHPGEDVDAPIKLTFCSEFQNRECTYGNCKYIHASDRVEQEYRTSGVIPSEVARDVIDRYKLCVRHLKGECSATPCKFRHTNLNLDITGLDDLPLKRNLCKDFINDRCQRGDSCKFSHASGDYANGPPNLCKDFINDRCQRGDSCKFSHASGDNGPPNRKRRMMDEGAGPDMWMNGGDGNGMRGGGGMVMGGGNYMGMGGGGNGMRGGMDMGVMGPPPHDYMRLQRENEQLRMENSDLRREMDGLKATNKFLLEETANMRLEAKTGGTEARGMGDGYHSMGSRADMGPGGSMGTRGDMGAGGSVGSQVDMGPGGSMRSRGDMGAGGSTGQRPTSGYGAIPGMSYGGNVGQQVNPQNRYSQDREGNQMFSRRDEGGRW